MIVSKEYLNEVIREEYAHVLKEHRVKMIYHNFNKLTISEKKECEKLGYQFYRNLLNSKRNINYINEDFKSALKKGAEVGAKIGDEVMSSIPYVGLGPAGFLLKKLNDKYKIISPETQITVVEILLDLAGFIPALGEIADALTLTLYALKKDYISALLSAVSMIPDLGDVFAKPIKWFLKTVNIIPPKYAEKFLPLLKKYGPQALKIAESVLKKIPMPKNQFTNVLENIRKSLLTVVEILEAIVSGDVDTISKKLGNAAAAKLKEYIKDTIAQRQQKASSLPSGQLQPA